VPEPVLRDYKNIECRDAVLAWDGAPEPICDATGEPVTRWDGESTKLNSITGEQVPDETKRVPVYKYRNPRKAEWPEADFIVGNPPFIGSKRMREALGDGYVDALRGAYDMVPDGTDLVLYWWTRAAELLRNARVRRFGFITTNSITQSMNRRATEARTFNSANAAILWAIADHPWVDSATGAAVRIAMTVGGPSQGRARLLSIVDERNADGHEVNVTIAERQVSEIHSDLRSGAAVTGACALRSNGGVCSVGFVRFGEGFVVDDGGRRQLEASVVRPLLTGRDLNQVPAGRYVIDFYPMDEASARTVAPRAFQHVLEHVKPGRDQIRDNGSRVRW